MGTFNLVLVGMSAATSGVLFARAKNHAIKGKAKHKSYNRVAQEEHFQRMQKRYGLAVLFGAAAIGMLPPVPLSPKVSTQQASALSISAPAPQN